MNAAVVVIRDVDAELVRDSLIQPYPSLNVVGSDKISGYRSKGRGHGSPSDQIRYRPWSEIGIRDQCVKLRPRSIVAEQVFIVADTERVLVVNNTHARIEVRFRTQLIPSSQTRPKVVVVPQMLLRVIAHANLH